MSESTYSPSSGHPMGPTSLVSTHKPSVEEPRPFSGKRRRDCPPLRLDTTLATEQNVTYADINNPIPKRRKVAALRPPTPFPTKNAEITQDAIDNIPSPILGAAGDQIDSLHLAAHAFSNACLDITQAMRSDTSSEVLSVKELATVQVMDVTSAATKHIATVHQAIIEPLQECLHQVRAIQLCLEQTVTIIQTQSDTMTRTMEKEAQKASIYIGNVTSAALEAISHGHGHVQSAHQEKLAEIEGQLCLVNQSFAKTSSTVQWLSKVIHDHGQSVHGQGGSSGDFVGENDATKDEVQDETPRTSIDARQQ